MVLEAFRVILAHTLELAKYHEKRSQDRFDGFVRPMNEKIQWVHGEYLAMFGAALRAIQDGSPISHVTQALDRARNESAAVRHEFFRVADAVRRNNDLPQEVQQFVGAICDYFDTLRMYSSGTPASIVRNYLRSLAEREQRELRPETLIELRSHAMQHLEKTIERLDWHSHHISERYGALLSSRYA